MRIEAARRFAQDWDGVGYEKGDTQKFWTLLLRDVLHYDRMESVYFEKRTADGGYIDVWIKDAGVMIEQKSFGVDLDKPELRQGEMKTPLKQVIDYAESFPITEQPKYVVTCNFGLFRVYDRTQYGRNDLPGNQFEFSLKELGKHPEYLDFIINEQNVRLQKEKDISIKAGDQIGKLYDKLRLGYIDPDSTDSMHALNVLCVRLVFCLFCEDAGLFGEKDAFLKYLQKIAPEDIRSKLKHLFKILDTPNEQRDPYDVKAKVFPYVDGGLFREEVEVPNFTQEMKDYLLNEVSAPIDWSGISPTIFGGIFEGTLNPDRRRAGGMHYTSPENIHRVIDPLFLDDLKKELNDIRTNETLSMRSRTKRMKEYLAKLSQLQFLDPACGSGNFLTETYLSLRKLEDTVLSDLHRGQISMAVDDESISDEDHVKLEQFHGIEINDFAVSVAETALWISRLRANSNTAVIIDMTANDFPLKDKADIVHGNALRLDWNDVLSASNCTYIIGNPPFVGSSLRSSEQTEDMKEIAFKGLSNWGKVDYCGAWYYMAQKYMEQNPAIQCAFVSTNSICQGEQVKPMWKWLFDHHVEIKFAWKTFVWDSEAADLAHVHCVIIGFRLSSASSASGVKLLYDPARQDSRCVGNINGYLSPAPNVFISNRARAVDRYHREIVQGSKAVDGGNLLLQGGEKDDFVGRNPSIEKYIRPYLGADEFLNNKKRWVIWLKDADISDVKQSREMLERLRAVATVREKSPTEEFRRFADRPMLFVQDRHSETTQLLFPQVSSSSRVYMPVGYVGPEYVISNAAYSIPDASLYDFGIVSSLMHNAWLRVICGRLKSDYRYSPVVYNSFAYPDPDDTHRTKIEDCANEVLKARLLYPDCSLADMYKPENGILYPELMEAHRVLDASVEAAYGVNFHGDEEKIVAFMFNKYAEKTSLS
ncbi:MAG: SAM-dependent DNA methyltransferase [Thermoguttaceae bacterium]|nr:SAM-dependent DNA methyltransferase [Thermoguttaceae bacterium]